MTTTHRERPREVDAFRFDPGDEPSLALWVGPGYCGMHPDISGGWTIRHREGTFVAMAGDMLIRGTPDDRPSAMNAWDFAKRFAGIGEVVP